MEEHRRAPRKRTLLDGRVIFNNRFSIIECTIRDLSTTGAKIAFAHPTPLPSLVELEIFKTGQNLQARTVWSDGKMHGLAFTTPLAPEPAPAEMRPPAVETPSSTQTTGTIQAIIDAARLRIAEQVGVSPEKVRLKLEIDS